MAVTTFTTALRGAATAFTLAILTTVLAAPVFSPAKAASVEKSQEIVDEARIALKSLTKN